MYFGTMQRYLIDFIIIVSKINNLVNSVVTIIVKIFFFYNFKEL